MCRLASVYRLGCLSCTQLALVDAGFRWTESLICLQELRNLAAEKKRSCRCRRRKQRCTRQQPPSGTTKRRLRALLQPFTSTSTRASQQRHPQRMQRCLLTGGIRHPCTMHTVTWCALLLAYSSGQHTMHAYLAYTCGPGTRSAIYASKRCVV